LRVLLTNNTLDLRAGSELWVRDAALALLDRGHRPIAYSRRLGGVAEELRGATVVVLDDLERLTEPPDLIHGHHHLETMTALLRFPGVPAIAFCHGWLPPEEAPVAFPRIRRYVAVDELTRERIVTECGLPAERVSLLLNFVDLRRFRPRDPLPRQPRRALVFSNQASDESFLPVVRSACAAAGIALDVMGIASGTACDRPERLLGAYDLVFAKGRAALEACAVGAAVVLCDASGLGPMVTARELDRLRLLNLGVRLLREPHTTEAVAARLESYDPEDAARVRDRVRAEAGLDAAIDRLLRLYEEVLAEHRDAPLVDPRAELVAASRYLRHGPLRGGDTFQAERERLVSRAAGAEAESEVLRRQMETCQATVADLRGGRERVARENGNLVLERDSLNAACDALRARLASLEAGAAATAARQDAGDLALAETKMALARAEEERAALRREVDWMAGTATWRWRERAVRRGWLVGLYRWLRGGPWRGR
jgi:hypothetical protein